MTGLPERLSERLDGSATFLPDDPTVRTHEPQLPSIPSRESVCNDKALPYQPLRVLRNTIADPKWHIHLLDTLNSILQEEEQG